MPPPMNKDETVRPKLIEELQAGDAFREQLVPKADGLKNGGVPFWHGWALMDAFLAGVDWSAKTYLHETVDRGNTEQAMLCEQVYALEAQLRDAESHLVWLLRACKDAAISQIPASERPQPEREALTAAINRCTEFTALPRDTDIAISPKVAALVEAAEPFAQWVDGMEADERYRFKHWSDDLPPKETLLLGSFRRLRDALKPFRRT